MTDLHKAAQQALDWLYDNDVVHPTKVSEDLRTALAQQTGSWQDGVLERHLRERERWLAQQAEPVEPVQEPEGLDWRYTARIGYVVKPYAAPPQHKPLAEWQINDLMANIDPEDVCSWSFRQGVYAAEKHHGIRP